MKKYLLLCISVIAAMTVANAQTEDDSGFIIDLPYVYPAYYSYKTIDGAESNETSYYESGNTNVIRCLNFSKGPFAIQFSYQANKEVKKTLKVSLYVPKKAFVESFKRKRSDFGGYEYYEGVNEYDDGNFRFPTLDDLEKMKEFTIEANTTWNYWENRFDGSVSIPWDGMTDPSFTGGKSYPIQSNVWTIVTDAQTGAILNNYEDYIQKAFVNLKNKENIFPQFTRVNRYRGSYTFTYTAKEHSVVCDIYFMSQLPIKKAIPFLGYDCEWWRADWSQLEKGGIEKMVLSILNNGDWGYLYGPWDDKNLNAYQVFDNLEPDENGIYHISWEIKDLQGNFFDVGKMLIDPDYFAIGLYVEGDGQETFNFGLPEFGGQHHGSDEYEPVWDLRSYEYRHPPRPLKPNETVNYPEFDMSDGVLFHYHGKGGNVVIPESVSKINDFALFRYSETLYQQAKIQKITLPWGLKSIGNYAFGRLKDLTSMTIPGTVTSIGDFAFFGCTGLTSITIPCSVTSIGDHAFWGCNYNDSYYNYPVDYKLASVTCYATTPPAAATAFSSVNLSKCTLYVPIGSKVVYASADGWKDFKNIVETSVTSIDTISKDNVSIQTNPNGISVESNEMVPVVVYSVAGQKVYESNVQGNMQINLNKGIYIVKAGEAANKIIVR